MGMERKMMSKEELQKVAFYRDGTIESVLMRYEFSEEEKKIIQAAILTSKKEQPSISIIDRADKLLQTVSSSRAPKQVEMVDSKTLSSAIGRTSSPSGGKRFSLWWWVALPIAFMLAIKLFTSLS